MRVVSYKFLATVSITYVPTCYESRIMINRYKYTFIDSSLACMGNIIIHIIIININNKITMNVRFINLNHRVLSPNTGSLESSK